MLIFPGDYENLLLWERQAKPLVGLWGARNSGTYGPASWDLLDLLALRQSDLHNNNINNNSRCRPTDSLYKVKHGPVSSKRKALDLDEVDLLPLHTTEMQAVPVAVIERIKPTTELFLQKDGMRTGKRRRLGLLGKTVPRKSMGEGGVNRSNEEKTDKLCKYSKNLPNKEGDISGLSNRKQNPKEPIDLVRDCSDLTRAYTQRGDTGDKQSNMPGQNIGQSKSLTTATLKIHQTKKAPRLKRNNHLNLAHDTWIKTVPIKGYSPDIVNVSVLEDDHVILVQAKEDVSCDDDDDVIECMTLNLEITVPKDVNLQRLETLFKGNGTLRLRAPRHRGIFRSYSDKCGKYPTDALGELSLMDIEREVSLEGLLSPIPV